MSKNSKKMRKARKDRLAATPAKPSERIVGSKKNPSGSASSVSSASNIELSQEIVRALQTKVRMHNKKMSELGKPSHAMASLGMLKSVFRRGAGAYSSSHRPGMTRNQWAYGRVNAFLRMLDKGKPMNLRYVNDSDLLPEGHPWKKTSLKSDETQEVKAIGRKLRRISQATEPYDPNAVDGDSDGTVQEGTPWERPVVPRVARSSQTAISGAMNIDQIIEFRNTNKRNGPMPVGDSRRDVMYAIQDKSFFRPILDDLFAQGFVIKITENGEFRVYSPYTNQTAQFTGKAGSPRARGNALLNLSQVGFIHRGHLTPKTKPELLKRFGSNDVDEIASANPDKFAELQRTVKGGTQAVQSLDKQTISQIVAEARPFLSVPEDDPFRNLDAIAEIYNITDDAQKEQLRNELNRILPGLLVDNDKQNPKLSGSMKRQYIAGNMTVNNPPPDNPDPWDDALEKLVEEEYENAFNELMEIADADRRAAQDDEAFFKEAIDAYDIWKDSQFARPNWTEREWIDDQPGRYAPEPPELRDPDSIDWDKMLAAIQSDMSEDTPWAQIQKEQKQRDEENKKLRTEWNGRTKKSAQKRADLWKQFTSEDVWIDELADEHSTPSSILRSALLKAGVESGMEKDDVERALRAAERSWRRRRDSYEENRALAEIDAEIDAMGDSLPTSSREIDRKLNRISRKIRRVREARNQASSEYQAARRAYTRTMVLGSWLYKTKPKRKSGESSEDFANRMYEWAVETNPVFMDMVRRLDEMSEVGTGTRGLFRKLDTQLERLRDEETRLNLLKERASNRRRGESRALSPVEFRKAVQERKRADEALRNNPMYKRFISGAMSSSNFSKKPLSDVAKNRTGSLTPREAQALSYLDRIGGSSAAGSIVTPSGRRISGSMVVKPSHRLHIELDVPTNLPSEFTDADYTRGLTTEGRYGMTRRTLSPSRLSKVWKPIIQAVNDHVTRRRKEGEFKRAVIIGGAPGSGKTTKRLDGFGGRIPNRRQAAHVDIDEMKQLLPEYNEYIKRGSSQGAGATHSESQQLAFATIDEAISRGNDVVFDSSGQFNRDPDTLGKLRRAGYLVEAHYFVGDEDVLTERIRERKRQTGRAVPEYFVNNIQSNLKYIMPSIMSEFNQFSLWANDSDGEPVLLARKAYVPGDSDVWEIQIFDSRALSYMGLTGIPTRMRIGEKP